MRQMSAGLILGKSLHGRLFIRNSDQRLVAEVYKVEGRSIELGLEPGAYEIHFDQKPEKFKATVEIKDGERFSLQPKNLYAVDSEETTSRGNTKKPKEVRSLSLGIVDRMEQPYDGVQLSLIGNRAAQETGTQIASIFNISDGEVSGMQLSLLMNKADGNVKFGQISTFMKLALGDVKDLQISGFVNATKGTADGAQIGTANIARTLDGLQLGMFNAIEDGLGGQIGTVNLATGKMQGLQFWVINLTGGAMKVFRSA